MKFQMERFLLNPHRLSSFTLPEKNMNRKILSLLFLLYNKKGPPIWLPSIAASLLLLLRAFRVGMGDERGFNCSNVP